MKTQELKSQIEELTTQNELMVKELNKVKKMLEKQSNQANQEDNSSGLSDLANDLNKIKTLADHLENKTSQFVSDQTKGNLSEKDVVDLVLILISGMVDWAAEFITNNSNTANSNQSQ